MEKGKIQETSDGLGSSTCAKILPEGGKSASLFFLTYSWGPRSSQGMMMTQTCQPSCAIPQGEFRGEELPPPPPVDLLDINLLMGLKKSHLFKQHCKYHFCFLEPLYTLLSESSLVDFVSISHTAKRLPPKIRICLVCYQKEIWSKQHGSNWGLQESQIRHSFSQVSEIFQISVDLASFQLLEKLKKVCPWHVQACPSGNFPTFI